MLYDVLIKECEKERDKLLLPVITRAVGSIYPLPFFCLLGEKEKVKTAYSNESNSSNEEGPLNLEGALFS